MLALVANLIIPFTATWAPESGFERISEIVKVHALSIPMMSNPFFSGGTGRSSSSRKPLNGGGLN